MRFSSLLTVAGTQLYDLKNALAHQLWLNNIQLLLHMPELLLKLRLLTATALLISSLIASGARFTPVACLCSLGLICCFKQLT